MHRRPSVSGGRVARRLWTIGLGVWCVVVGASLHMQKTHAGEGEKAKAEEETFGRSTTLFPIVKDGKLGFIDRKTTATALSWSNRSMTERRRNRCWTGGSMAGLFLVLPIGDHLA